MLAGGALIASDFFDSRSQAVRFVQVGVWCSLAGTVLFSRCLRRGHPAAARALLGSFLLLIATAVGLATAGFIRPHDRLLSLSNDEKVPLQLRKGSQPPRWEHPVFAFSLPALPDEFVPRSFYQLTGEIREEELGVYSWWFEALDPPARVMIRILNGQGATEAGFRLFSSTHTSAPDTNQDVQITQESTSWTNQSGDHYQRMLVNGDVCVETRCLASGPTGSPRPFIVCVAITYWGDNPVPSLPGGLSIP